MNREREQDYQVLRNLLRLSVREPEDWPESQPFRRFVKAMKLELTPRQRELIRLYYLHQRTMEDIARELGVNKSTICRTIHRGVKRLERVMRYEYPGYWEN